MRSLLWLLLVLSTVAALPTWGLSLSRDAPGGTAARRGSLAHFGTAEGLDLDDLTDPHRMRFVRRIQPGTTLQVVLDGDRLYILGQFGAGIYDASDFENPVLLGAILLTARSLAAEGDLRVFNVSGPAQPVEIGQPAFGSPFELMNYAGRVYSTTRGTITDPDPEYLPALAIDMELRPRLESNPVNPTSAGSIRVVLYGSDEVDLAEIRPESYALGPERGFASLVSVRDTNRDGFDDVSLRFPIQGTGIAFGDERICLRGRFEDGRPFRGCDAITTGSGCGLGFEVAPLLVGIAALRARRRRAAERSRLGRVTR